MVTVQSTPFGTLHYSGTGTDAEEVKRSVRKAAKGHGRALTFREHTIGRTVQVFAIYRQKAS